MPLRWYRMNSYANYIETIIEHEPENKLLEASALYSQSFSTIPEMTYYKTLERMCKKGILVLHKSVNVLRFFPLLYQVKRKIFIIYM